MLGEDGQLHLDVVSCSISVLVFMISSLFEEVGRT